MKEQYNNTRRWLCYEAALLMKKNEIRKDRKYSLTTPEHGSVLQSTMSPFKSFPSGFKENQRGRNSLEGKEKKIFFHKRNLYSSCSRIYSSIVRT
jgi:hypothetical protein